MRAVLSTLAIAVSGVMAPGPVAAVPTPTAVIADVGWSINPYHEVFRRPGWTQPPAIPGVQVLPLTLGSEYAPSRAADGAVWDAYQSGVLYWVPGTNLLLLTIRSPGVLPDGATDASFHGTGSSGVIADECADCYALFVQDAPLLDGTAVKAIVDSMSWVDLVVSTNTTGDWLLVAPRLAEQTRRLHDSGRIFLAATGNYAVTGLAPGGSYHQVALPPWVVSVGGARPECRGTDVQAARPAEIVGKFRTSVAAHATVTGRLTAYGTSFAAPQIAAGLGKVLLSVRRALGDTRSAGALWSGDPYGSGVLSDGVLTAEEIRSVAWLAARRYTTSEFEASCVDVQEIAGSLGSPTPVSAAPWTDMGWGYVGPDEAAEASRIVLDDLGPMPDPAAKAYLDSLMTTRVLAFWPQTE